MQEQCYMNITPALPLPTQVLVADMEEKMKNEAERLEIHFSTRARATRIHKFPRNLRGIGGADGRYVVPSMVAIGPYHHGLAHLQEMEEVKPTVAFQFCTYWGCSVEEVYGKIFSLAGDARSCYSSCAVANLSDAEFAAMMFLDGCFLLMFLTLTNEQPPLLGHSLASWPIIVRDTLLLENQIPWLVLEALCDFIRRQRPDLRILFLLHRWIDVVTEVYFFDRQTKNISLSIRLKRSLQTILMKCQRVPEENKKDTDEDRSYGESEPPPHLLGLLRFRMTTGMPSGQRAGKNTPNSSLTLPSSAVYLAQLGVKLTASTATWFPDMNVQKKPVLGELSLSPLFLNDVAASILANLAAFEVAQATDAVSGEADGFVVCSYLSVLAMLMDREEDVQELRRRGLLSSHFSNAQTLAFFKIIAQHLRLGYNYFAIVQEIEDYIRKRPVRIAVHRFLYNNYKLLAVVLSIASVLVGIFKTLYSLKKAY